MKIVRPITVKVEVIRVAAFTQTKIILLFPKDAIALFIFLFPMIIEPRLAERGAEAVLKDALQVDIGHAARPETNVTARYLIN